MLTKDGKKHGSAKHLHGTQSGRTFKEKRAEKG